MSVQPKTFAVAGLLLAAALPGQAAFAQGDAGAQAMMEEVVTVGTRRKEGRSLADSLVPVDLIAGDELRAQGSTNMDRLLTNLIPSYNVTQQPLNDEATLVRPARLRGLPPDATLVLVNGKRRHRASVIILGGQVANGAQGPDISTIPTIALQRVEVLRDGAAAQYGSDAIAGVINFQLKEAAEGATVEARWGQYYEADGDLVNLSANAGFPMGGKGFINLSFEYKQSDRTDRSQQRSDATALIDADNGYITDPSYDYIFHPNVMVWGAPEFDYDYKFFANLGREFSDSMEGYGHVSYAKRRVEGGFFYRNPVNNGSIFHTTATVDGMADVRVVRVADLHLHNTGMPAPAGQECPTIKIVSNVADPDGLAMLRAREDDNCQALITRFPGGYTPRFGGVMEDYSLMGGVRGDIGEWFFDASLVYGHHKTSFFIRHTINPQLLAVPSITAANIPTEYEPGSYQQTDFTLNADASRSFALDFLASPLHLGFGLEYRQEEFQVFKGDDNSRFLDNCAGQARVGMAAVKPADCPSDEHLQASLLAKGFFVGSHGFPGFNESAEGTWSRDSIALYFDLEAEVITGLTLGLAGRHEDHDGVGTTTDFKFSARAEIDDNLALRTAVSTGFRAPTVGQSNYRATTTTFIDGELQAVATLPPTHPASRLIGGKPLTPEESRNYTIGAVFNWGIADITLDYFRIKLEDRITATSELELSEENKMALRMDPSLADATSFNKVSYYTNDFDTTTEGVDLVVSWQANLFRGTTNFSLAGNWTKNRVDHYSREIIEARDYDRQVTLLEKSLPKTRFTLSADHTQGNWNLLARVRRYAGFTTYWGRGFRQDTDSRNLVDFEASYLGIEDVTVILGAENVFDTYPSRWEAGASGGNPSGQQYPAASPYGFNGGFYYVRLLWER